MFKQKAFLIFALGFAVIGVTTLVLTKAATPVSSLEVENGTATTAQILNDTTASAGKAVKFASATVDPTQQKCAQLTNLQFCDDFDGAAGTAPDSTKWRVFGSGSSWGSQCWKNLPENISMDGTGNLKLTLLNKGTTQCTNYYGNPSAVTSGGMDTQNKKYFKHGKFEIRAKLSCADSTWGSIWTATGTGPAWPGSGEIDIWESTRGRKYQLKQSIHAGATQAEHYHQGTEYNLPTNQRLCDEYHVYGMEWRQGYIQFTFDGQNTNRITEASAAQAAANAGKPAHWPFDTYDQRLLIDLQYGETGNTTTGDPNLSQLPSSMLVDYVRIYN